MAFIPSSSLWGCIQASRKEPSAERVHVIFQHPNPLKQAHGSVSAWQPLRCVQMLAAAARRMSRLLETWCLMEYAEKGSLADALRTGRLRRQNGFPELGVIIACLQDIASGRPP